MFLNSYTSVRSSKYIPFNCILTRSMVIDTYKDPQSCVKKYVSIWKSSGGYSVTLSPISAVSDFSEAEKQLNDYPLHTSLKCLCDPKNRIRYPNVDKDNQCTFYSKCFLSLDILRDIKSRIYLYGLGVALFTAGSVGILFVIIIFCFIRPNKITENYINPMDEL